MSRNDTHYYYVLRVSTKKKVKRVNRLHMYIIYRKAYVRPRLPGHSAIFRVYREETRKMVFIVFLQHYTAIGLWSHFYGNNLEINRTT